MKVEQTDNTAKQKFNETLPENAANEKIPIWLQKGKSFLPVAYKKKFRTISNPFRHNFPSFLQIMFVFHPDEKFSFFSQANGNGRAAGRTFHHNYFNFEPLREKFLTQTVFYIFFILKQLFGNFQD